MAEKSKNAEQEEKNVIVPKKASDIQRFKLEKLMKNPVSIVTQIIAMKDGNPTYKIDDALISPTLFVKILFLK